MSSEIIVFLKKLTTPQRLTISFLVVILVGSLILNLPIMQQAGVQTTYLDHLFTTVSMVCVTGLTVITVGEVYNLFGQMICILLMQIGGLGLITLLAASTFYLKKKMSLREQYALQASFSHEVNIELKPLLQSIYLFTFVVEAVATVLLSFIYVPRYGLFKGVFNAFFLSVSAFCNAGFDNLGSTSLQSDVTHLGINIIIAILIIFGGIGFIVWFELIALIKEYIYSKPRVFKLIFRQFSFHGRLVLLSTAILLVFGTLLTWFTEYHNPQTIGQLNGLQQMVASFFQAVTMRTAGFSTLDYTLTKPITNLIYMVQMVIGGAPGGTAGGFKITTAALLVLIFRSELKGMSGVQFHKRTIDILVIRQMVTILVFFFASFIIGYGALLATQPHLDAFALLFETSSALATSGVTMNLTVQLNTVGRMIIMVLMFIGRVGPTTVLLSLVMKNKKEIEYAKTEVYLG